MDYDFAGWATKNDLRCSDKRIIRRDAFIECDGKTVPLVWNHQHDSVCNVLGHALLENRPEGVFMYGKFNDTELAANAKSAVENGDITSVSIYANQLKQNGDDVIHGKICEVSLVLAGANPGACITSIAHSSDETNNEEEGVIIYTGEELTLAHADTAPAQQGSGSGETIGDVFNTLSEKQKTAVYAIIAMALEKEKSKSNSAAQSAMYEEGDYMAHNVFDEASGGAEDILSHSEEAAVFNDIRRYGSLRESMAQHGITEEQIAHAITDDHNNSISYGIANIDYLYPEDRLVNKEPIYIKRDTDWVATFNGGVNHVPFTKIKSMMANITGEDARARGYVKGTQKVNEVLTLLKRSTDATTVYKHQKLDRDDIIDIKDFSVANWLRAEMRIMLDEELARARLIGDGRDSSSNDKIDETRIRPIWTDNDLFTIKSVIEHTTAMTEDQKAKAFIRQCVKARKDYRGNGTPTMYTTEDMLTTLLLLEDTTGRIIYDTVDKLCRALRVDKIVTVPLMENKTRTVESKTHYLDAIIVNPKDYTVGTNQGGEISTFSDFDIDYNQEKYLIETRTSGAMTTPYGAIAVEHTVAAAPDPEET